MQSMARPLLWRIVRRYGGLMPAFVLAVTLRKARTDGLGPCVSRFRTQAVGRARIRLNRVRQRTVRVPLLQTVYASVIKTHAIRSPSDHAAVTADLVWLQAA